jgi:predicted RNA binding protein YcfA (HicA-like mRNA interferase family)
MGKYAELIQTILSGTSDANIRFSELTRLLLRMGFEERIRGDHHIFSKQNVEEIVNLQPKGSMAKPYQVKQVRNLILRYKLGVDDDAK